MSDVPAARLHRRAGVLIAAVLITAVLTACGVVVERVAAPRPAAVPVVQHADLRYAGTHVLNDDRDRSLVILPKRSNGALVVFLHGWGQDRWSLIARRKEATVSHTLSAAGYTMLAADAGGKAWGDPSSVADYRSLIRATQRRYDLRDVFLMGESMGGLATMQLARTLPEVRAVTAWFPVCDVRTMRAPRFRDTIREAWRGRSRAGVSPVRVGPKPMLIWASAADTVVDARRNSAVCVTGARAAGAQVTYFHTSGEHGDPSNYDPDAVLAFFQRYRSPGI